jgi:hypothetical protein
MSPAREKSVIAPRTPTTSLFIFLCLFAAIIVDDESSAAFRVQRTAFLFPSPPHDSHHVSFHSPSLPSRMRRACTTACVFALYTVNEISGGVLSESITRTPSASIAKHVSLCSVHFGIQFYNCIHIGKRGKKSLRFLFLSIEPSQYKINSCSISRNMLSSPLQKPLQRRLYEIRTWTTAGST